MEFKECPMYNQCLKSEEKFVSKEACGFRWEIITTRGEEILRGINHIHTLEKNVEVIQNESESFGNFIKLINEKIEKLEEKLEKLLTINEVKDQAVKIHMTHKKRKQHIRDTIITGVVIAFFVGILAGGWQMFKKVSIILENSKIHQIQTVQPISPNLLNQSNVNPYIYHPHIDKPKK